MTRYESLKRSAIESAEARGHELGRFGFVLQPNRMVGNSLCRKCGAGVTINTNPMPNQIDIGGRAVAVNCEPLPAEDELEYLRRTR